MPSTITRASLAPRPARKAPALVASGVLALALLIAGLFDVAVGALLYFYPASGALGLPPATPTLFPRLAGGAVLAMGIAQLLSLRRPPRAVVIGAAAANGLSVATLVPFLLAGPAGVTIVGRAILWAAAAILAGACALQLLLLPADRR